MSEILAIGALAAVVYLIYRNCARRNREARLIQQYNNQMSVRNRGRYYNLETNQAVVNAVPNPHPYAVLYKIKQYQQEYPYQQNQNSSIYNNIQNPYVDHNVNGAQTQPNTFASYGNSYSNNTSINRSNGAYNQTAPSNTNITINRSAVNPYGAS